MLFCQCPANSTANKTIVCKKILVISSSQLPRMSCRSNFLEKISISKAPTQTRIRKISDGTEAICFQNRMTLLRSAKKKPITIRRNPSGIRYRSPAPRMGISLWVSTIINFQITLPRPPKMQQQPPMIMKGCGTARINRISVMLNRMTGTVSRSARGRENVSS